MHAKFNFDSSNRIASMYEHAEFSLDILLALRAFYDGSQLVEAKEFSTFIRTAQGTNNHYAALEWLPRVLDKNRDDTALNPEITERDSSGGLVLAAHRQEYYPVLYGVTQNNMETIRGFDRASDLLQREAMLLARDEGKIFLSQPITLSRNGQRGQAYVAFEPVYQGGNAENNVHSRRDRIKGFISGLFIMRDLVEGSFEHYPPAGIDIYLYDVTTPGQEQFLYKHSSRTRTYDAPELSMEDIRREGGLLRYSQVIDISGRKWLAICLPTRQYLGALRQRWLPYASFAVMLTTLTGITYLLWSTNRHAMLLADSQEKIQAALNVKTEFASMVSHELRTPLSVISEGINLVTDGIGGPVTEKQKEFLGLSTKNINRLSKLIDNILDFQKLEAGRMDLQMEEQALDVLVKDVCRDFTSVAGTKGLVLDLDCGSGPMLAVCDKDKIIQVLHNLLSNAVKFTDRGRISVTLQHQGDRIRVSVEDQGPGIKAEDIPKLFQSFSQIPMDGKRKTGGSGLGLAICKKILELQGGSIGVSSVFGQGSIFYFEVKAA